jgi:ATP-dependent Clp protease ATP-binding subunit ClpB
MQLDKMTVKVREALQVADSLAHQYNNPQIENEHLFLALLRQKEGLVVPLFERLGVSLTQMENQTLALVEKLPKSYGPTSQRSISPKLTNLLYASLSVASSFKDEFVSVEHLLLALLEEGGSVASILKNGGVSKDNLLQALQMVRGKNDLFKLIG